MVGLSEKSLSYTFMPLIFSTFLQTPWLGEAFIVSSWLSSTFKEASLSESKLSDAWAHLIPLVSFSVRYFLICYTRFVVVVASITFGSGVNVPTFSNPPFTNIPCEFGTSKFVAFSIISSSFSFERCCFGICHPFGFLGCLFFLLRIFLACRHVLCKFPIWR